MFRLKESTSKFKMNSLSILRTINKSISHTTTHEHFHKLYDLRTDLGPSPKTYLELGAWYGNAVSLLFQHPYKTNCISIDTGNLLTNQEDIYNKNTSQFNKYGNSAKFIKEECSNRQFVLKLKSELKVDLLFFDVSTKQLIHLFNMYSQLVNPGGYIVFDDYSDYQYSPHIKPQIDKLVKYLNTSNYEIIGCGQNENAYDCLNLTKSNLFIIKKREIVGPNYIVTSGFQERVGIVIATYYRPKDTTAEYLKRSLDSVLKQTYTNWDLIVVGDKYELEGELLEIINLTRQKTSNRIIYLSNPLVERDYVLNNNSLWCTGGASSMNMGLNYCRTNGYKYYAHLDDDDYWLPIHVKSLMDIYQEHPTCVFTYSQSVFMSTVLPAKTMDIFPNNLVPNAQSLIHSSVIFRADVIPFNYTTKLTAEGHNYPSDATLWKQINDWFGQHPEYCAIYSGALTCGHPEEGAMFK